MPDYPGLGLPLRHNPQEDYGHYPIGAHGSCWGADSDMLPIRELAMMSIMDCLTDKEDWQKKVFDDEIVSKWREEALAIPDEQFCKLAKCDKSQYWDEDGNLNVRDDYSADHVEPLKGIMTTNTFDCVCSILFILGYVLILNSKVRRRTPKQSQVLRKVRPYPDPRCMRICGEIRQDRFIRAA
jgi:hypothetical protein